MQKILIVSPKAISLPSFEGAQGRIFDIAKFLSKKNKIDFVCTSNKDPAADYVEGKFPKIDEAIRNAKRGKR